MKRGSALKGAALGLLLLGLGVGPGYWVQSRFFTGDEAALVTLTPEAGKPGLLRIWKSGPFRLEEGMAPVGLILLAQGHFSPNMDEHRPPRDSYSATLTRDGTAAEPLKFSLGVKHVSDSNPAFKEHLLLMQKVTAGEYQLAVTQAAEPAIEIDRMQLQVRQHLREPDPDIVMAGIALMVLAILVLVVI